jgi:uncharacterized protein (DUF2225 family)
MENKVYAIKKLVNFRKKEYQWWAVIDCGETKENGMTIGNFFNSHFAKDGRTFRYYSEIFMPSEDLKEWQEINVLTKNITVVVDKGMEFKDFDDKEDSGLEALVNFSKLIGKELTIQEVKNLINEN